MKNYFLTVCRLSISTFQLYCTAEGGVSKSLTELGKEEEKAWINMLENKSPENIAKHKEITQEFLKAAGKFAEEYCNDQKALNSCE